MALGLTQACFLTIQNNLGYSLSLFNSSISLSSDRPGDAGAGEWWKPAEEIGPWEVGREVWVDDEGGLNEGKDLPVMPFPLMRFEVDRCQ